MNHPEKPIKLSQHAKEQAGYRGCTETEIIQTIQTSHWETAELNRLECKKDFTFNAVWNKRKYKTKQIKPIFKQESKEIIVITVYVYYF